MEVSLIVKMDSQLLLDSFCQAIKIRDTENVRSIILKNPEIIKPVISESPKPDYQANLIDEVPRGLLEPIPALKVRSPLWQAMLRGYEEIVELLIEHGADVDELFMFETNKFHGLTFLQSLALQDDFWHWGKKIAEILLKHGANINAYYVPTEYAPFQILLHPDDANSLYEPSTFTPLQIAIQQGNVDYAEFLLKYGANLKGSGWLRHCPMNLVLKAPTSKQKELLKLLIRFGVDTNDGSFNYLHRTIINAANGCLNTDHLLEMADILLDSGLSVNELDSKGRSLLYLTVLIGNASMVSYLIQKGASLHHDLSFKDFPLRLAAYFNNIVIAGLLLSNGAEVNEDVSGFTALHAACSRGNHQVAELLLQKGANINLEKFDDKETPFAVMNPQNYHDINFPCIKMMIKEIAKRKFFNLSVSQTDMDLIEAHLTLKELYQSCWEELNQMSKIKFYDSYTYSYVLKMFKNIKKLAHLTRNGEFHLQFYKNLSAFSHYENDLRRLYSEATELSFDWNRLYDRLRYTFNDFFPDIVIRTLADNITIEDLPLTQMEIFE